MTETVRPWINPGPKQEAAWQEQRLAALAETRRAVDDVLRLRSRADRQRYLSDYRAEKGDICADALEALVKSVWERRRAGAV